MTDLSRADLSTERHSCFGLDNFLLWCFVCITVECLAAALVTTRCQQHLLVIITETVSRLYQIPLGVGTGAKSMPP